jgi:hypothetical protein
MDFELATACEVRSGCSALILITTAIAVLYNGLRYRRSHVAEHRCTIATSLMWPADGMYRDGKVPREWGI